jgi:hypothetical protein
MIWISGKEIKMSRGWVVQYKDGTAICEDEMMWQKLPNKKDIARVILKWEDRTWSLDNKKYYTIPKKRGYVDVNAGGVGQQGIDARFIGFYDTDEGCKVYMKVDEATGKMTYETESG